MDNRQTPSSYNRKRTKVNFKSNGNVRVNPFLLNPSLKTFTKPGVSFSMIIHVKIFSYRLR